MAKTEHIKMSLLETNNGQIAGLPKNPRFIRDGRFGKLKESIKENPEMLELRELLVYPKDGKYVIIGGNMRYRACKELGYKSLPCKVLSAETTVEQLKAYTIKDNAGFGEWDLDMLANEWDEALLNACCLDIDYNDATPTDETSAQQEERYSIVLEFDSPEAQDKMEGELKKLSETIDFKYTLTR